MSALPTSPPETDAGDVLAYRRHRGRPPGPPTADPPVRPGQYLYRRIEQNGSVQELRIPADAGAEWMVRDSASNPHEQRAVDGEFVALPWYNPLTVADLSLDPSRNHTLLRVATGITPDPHVAALSVVISTLKSQPVPADLRAALLGALGFVPGMQVTTEDDGRTTVISAEGDAFGRRARTDLLLDTRTGQPTGDRYADDLGSYTTTVTTGVADDIGVVPGPP